MGGGVYKQAEKPETRKFIQTNETATKYYFYHICTLHGKS